MQYSKIILLLFSSIVLTTGLYGVNEQAGTTGFNFLKLTYSARAAALGSAFGAVDKDVEGMIVNPANLVTLENSQIKTTYMSYLMGYQGGGFALGGGRKGNSSIGFYTSYLQSDQITKTIISPYGEYEGTAGTFGSNEMMAGLVLSKYFSPMIQMGVTLKYIRESIDDKSASAAAVDLGITHQPVNPKVRVGLALRNLGTQLTYFTDSNYKETLPFTMDAGLRYQFNPQLAAMLDVVKSTGQDMSSRLGVEYKVNEMFTGRLGYKSNASDWKAGGNLEVLSGLSFGLGCYRANLGLDYAFVSYGDVGSVNQISLSYKF